MFFSPNHRFFGSQAKPTLIFLTWNTKTVPFSSIHKPNPPIPFLEEGQRIDDQSNLLRTTFLHGKALIRFGFLSNPPSPTRRNYRTRSKGGRRSSIALPVTKVEQSPPPQAKMSESQKRSLCGKPHSHGKPVSEVFHFRRPPNSFAARLSHLLNNLSNDIRLKIS